MKVSIITVSNNNAATIAKCLTSVYNQTWPDIEHIIIDNASNDGTVEIIHNTASRLVCFVSEPDNGIYEAINKGILLSHGDIIGILSADDVFFDSHSVEKIANVFQNHDIDCLYANLIFTNHKGKVVRVWRSKPLISGLFEKSWTPAHPTFYCKKQMYERYGRYKIDYKIAADVELMLRFIVVYKIKSYFLNDFLINMRYGGISTQGLRSVMIITKEMRRAFRENKMQFHVWRYVLHKMLKIKEILVSANDKSINLHTKP